MKLRRVYRTNDDFSFSEELWVVFGPYIGPVWVFKSESDARKAYAIIGVEFSKTPNEKGDYEEVRK